MNSGSSMRQREYGGRGRRIVPLHRLEGGVPEQTAIFTTTGAVGLKLEEAAAIEGVLSDLKRVILASTGVQKTCRAYNLLKRLDVILSKALGKTARGKALHEIAEAVAHLNRAQSGQDGELDEAVKCLEGVVHE